MLDSVSPADYGLSVMALPKSFFELVERSDKPILVDFWAEWCGPCKVVSPVVERVARTFKGRLLTVKVDVDKKQHVAARFNVTAVPTIALFWRGKQVMSVQGAQPYEELVRRIRSSWPKDAPRL